MSDEDKGEREPKDSGPESTAGSSAGARTGSESGERESRGREDSATSAAGVAFDAAMADAYAGGRKLTVSAGRDVHITFEAHRATGVRAVGATPGKVSAKQIRALRDAYAKVPEYDALLEVLRSQRLLVLVGRCSSGRSTTALLLLEALTGEALSRLPPLPTLAEINEAEIGTAHGYVGEVDLVGGEGTRVDADRLAKLLDDKGSYCVVVARPSPGLRRTLGHYLVECSAADLHDVLTLHVEAGIGDDDDPGRMMDLADDDRVRALIRPAAAPAQVAEIAGLVLAHGRGEIDMDEVEARATEILYDERIEEWFSVLRGAPHGIRAERNRHLTAMRIAVAVFDEMPRHIAESEAANLAGIMGTPASTARTGTPAGTPQLAIPRAGVRLLDPDDTLALLASTPIECERRDVPHGRRTVPGEVIRYSDDRMPAAVLRCVWQGQYALRGPVVEWLDGLSRDPRSDVRLRAAQAAGLLCSIDLTHTLDALIAPAAGAVPEAVRPAGFRTEDEPDEDDEHGDGRGGEVWRGRRYFAAVAVDQAARDPQLQKTLRGLLTRWRRADDPAMRWTAAVALGFDLGASAPRDALDELRVLGTPWEARRYRTHEAKRGRKRARALQQEKEVFHAAASGVEGLFRFGAHHEALAQLEAWIGDPRLSVRLLAYQAVIYIMGTSVATVAHPEHGVSGPPDELVSADDRRDRGRWPILLALHGRRSELQGLAADLVWRVLRSNQRKVALEVLGDWFEFAEDDDAMLAAVEAFLPRLVKEESDRGRLRGLVRQMRHRWEDPLAEDVADRLEDVIAGTRTVGGRTVLA